MDLHNKVALITGGTMGLGEAMAIDLAGHGGLYLSAKTPEHKLEQAVANRPRGG